MWSRKSKQRKSKELLIPRDGELLQGRFEISRAKEDHSDGIDDRRGCAAGGGGGCIYFAKDLATGRDVAIKFYSPLEPIKNHDDGGDAEWFQCDLDYSNKKKKDAFKKEQKIVAELSSLPSGEGKYFPEYIAKGSYRSKRPYYVMEKLQALTPAQYADEKTCEKIILEVCRAAQILSNHGKIALDIKPDNIMFRPADKHFVLVDMGLVADKDAYQKVSREALEKYSRLSLSAQCGTVGFFSELYSPHHEARMIYAIGGLIESWFGKWMPPEWGEIVFRCRRMDERNCISSISILIDIIKRRKRESEMRAIHGVRQKERDVLSLFTHDIQSFVEVRVSCWEDICFDLDVVNYLVGKGFRPGKYGTVLLPGLESMHNALKSTTSLVAEKAFRQVNGERGWDTWKLRDEDPTPTANDTKGKWFGIHLNNVLVHVETPVHLKAFSRIAIIGKGVVDVDLIGDSNVEITLEYGSTLLNRSTFASQKDLTTYNLGDYSYLNFSRTSDKFLGKMLKHVVRDIQSTAAIVRCSGPMSIGSLMLEFQQQVKLLGVRPLKRSHTELFHANIA